MISPELARHLAAVSHDIGRQVGVLVNRQGHVVDTFVGESQRIYLPDVGRARAGGGHLRGLRHIHTVFGRGGLSRDDVTDLTKLRLDAVCALEVCDDGEPGAVEYAHLLPGANRSRHRQESCRSVFELVEDFDAFIEALESESGRLAPAPRSTDGRERAIVLGVYKSKDDAAWRTVEIKELAATAGLEVVDVMTQFRAEIDPRFVVGRGKLEEAVLQCLDLDAQLMIVDHNLSPAQARAIAAASDLRVIDRTQLILDIFAQHAQSRDGKLQVELAQLKYTLPRLTDMDAGLSRLTGGIGGRGPGETKLEINRRRARDRMNRLEREIESLSGQRNLRRQKRSRGAVPTVSIVGYTNAGKSTLLNRLTQSQVLVADQLFATLDPSSRRLRFPREREAIITDTVGFIRDLPVDLMKAFRATLEELETADLLLHIIDIADPMRDHKRAAVDHILGELQLDAIPQIVVYNKSDQVPAFEARALANKAAGVAVSAQTGAGLDVLVEKVARRLWQIEALPAEDSWALPIYPC